MQLPSQLMAVAPISDSWAWRKPTGESIPERLNAVLTSQLDWERSCQGWRLHIHVLPLANECLPCIAQFAAQLTNPCRRKLKESRETAGRLAPGQLLGVVAISAGNEWRA